MIEVKSTDRWKKVKLFTLFDENKQKNTDFSVDHALQFCFGTIIPKKKYDLTDDLIETYRKYTIVHPGDIMINGLNLNYDFVSQRIAYVTETGIITSAYISLRSRTDLNSSYYCYLFKALDAQKMFHGMGTGIRLTLSYNELKYLELPVPPREEQDQIVRFLDWKVSEINRLINIKRKEISVLDEGIASRLKSELSKIPNARDIPLKRVFLVPMSDGPHETPEFVDEGVPFVSAEASHDGRIHLSECRGYITKQLHEQYCMKVKPQRDDIFIVKSGSTTGKTVIVDFDDEFSIWSPLALVRCNKLAVPRYVFYYCSSTMFQQQVRDNWSFGTQPNIGMGVLKDLHILLPSVEEQERIVKILDEYWNATLQLKENINKRIQCIEEYKTRLISDVVTGKIDVRGIEIPEYEYTAEEADSDSEAEAEELDEGADEE